MKTIFIIVCFGAFFSLIIFGGGFHEYKEEYETVNITVYEKHDSFGDRMRIETNKGTFFFRDYRLFERIGLFNTYTLKYDFNRVIIEIVEEVK